MPKIKSKSRPSKNSKKQAKKETSTLNLKEQLAQKRKAAQARKELTSLLTTATFGGVFIGIVLFFVGGIKAAIPGVLGIIIISLSYKYPRQALYTFIIYVPIGGTITYYLGNSPILQLAKDAFYIPALIGLWQTCRKQGLPLIIPQGIKIPLYIVLGCSLLTLLFINGGQQFNPPSVGLLEKAPQEIPLGMGILGLKVFLGYVPLIGCAYYLIRDKRDFLFLSRLQIALILICCVLGFIQYLLLLTGVCQGTRGLEGNALFVTSLEARCYFGGALLYSPEEGVIRLPGTFVAPWQWAWFLISSTFFTFATGFTDPSPIWRLVGLGSLVTVFINAVISGQRIALALVPICFGILLLLTGQIGNLKRFIPIGIGLALVLGIAMVTNPAVVQERTESFTGRWEASPPQDFIVQQFQENWKNVDGPLGSGLGRATNSARVMGETKLVETYYPKVLFEVGIIGVLAFLGLVTSLTIIGFKTYRSIKNRNFRSYGAALWVFILFISYNTYYYPLDVDPVAVYYWFFAGVLFKLPELEKQDIEDANPEQKNKKKRLKTI
ncbi:MULTISPECIES: hormogonium polysaccharide biosynthesis protein HpsL [unclassified Nostoc]|uniref:hormogonium polysaccharide biosynthesis protein HpsL n=1 Tax=unclassified Nostoc TaxID=2593658 RepID=UPI002AD320EC|nr:MULTISPECIES: hormogonium polysaccharide biosynthesis protein HpsL [unclassified Nostoc]MDZ8125277.1 hormogonium polysaccharide biosynthesis protein HpsL [Nostoc sp. CmiVER01]MDZ8222236.1 hormogonium polysaccharide biosynthesis protein HpsL [Nostoc sp. ChiVER01]